MIALKYLRQEKPFGDPKTIVTDWWMENIICSDNSHQYNVLAIQGLLSVSKA
jgi:hypothetical protein